jgi:hypothetical protein
MKMTSDWGRVALRAKNQLQEEEQQHVARARGFEDVKEIQARLEMSNVNWISILKRNPDTNRKMDELVSGSYPGEKLDDYIFREPHPDWDKDFMLIVIRQRLVNDEAWIQYEEAILEHPKTKAYASAERVFQTIMGR